LILLSEWILRLLVQNPAGQLLIPLQVIWLSLIWLSLTWLVAVAWVPLVTPLVVRWETLVLSRWPLMLQMQLSVPPWTPLRIKAVLRQRQLMMQVTPLPMTRELRLKMLAQNRPLAWVK